MQKEQVQHPTIKLVGLTVRTNNANEMNPETSQIASLAGRYWQDGLAGQIAHRESPGKTYSVYTDFESDEHGEYTYFIGEQVSTVDKNLGEYETIEIPEGKYQRFTTEPGAMPDVVVSAWQNIWKMTDTDFGGKRRYKADFEVYDQRAIDPQNSIVDIYIGIE